MIHDEIFGVNALAADASASGTVFSVESGSESQGKNGSAAVAREERIAGCWQHCHGGTPPRRGKPGGKGKISRLLKHMPRVFPTGTALLSYGTFRLPAFFLPANQRPPL